MASGQSSAKVLATNCDISHPALFRDERSERADGLASPRKAARPREEGRAAGRGDLRRAMRKEKMGRDHLLGNAKPPHLAARAGQLPLEGCLSPSSACRRDFRPSSPVWQSSRSTGDSLLLISVCYLIHRISLQHLTRIASIYSLRCVIYLF